MTEAERPYFYEPIDRLEVLVEHYAGDVAVLKDICVELLHRNARRARSLRVSAFANLMRSMSDYFEWPDTEAPGGDGSVDETYFNHDRGVLGFLGYSVGRTGIPVQARRDLLDQAFLGQLPKINSAEYMLEWGDRGTAGRLRKIAESIAAFARNAQRRRSGSMSEAIADWESDLEYLRVKHYERRFSFTWPATWT